MQENGVLVNNIYLTAFAKRRGQRQRRRRGRQRGVDAHRHRGGGVIAGRERDRLLQVVVGAGEDVRLREQQHKYTMRLDVLAPFLGILNGKSQSFYAEWHRKL